MPRVQGRLKGKHGRDTHIRVQKQHAHPQLRKLVFIASVKLKLGFSPSKIDMQLNFFYNISTQNTFKDLTKESYAQN